MQNIDEKTKLYFKTLAEIIKNERIKLKKSQRLLADEYAIQQSLISRIENCNNDPRLISIVTVCEALKMKPSKLFKKIEAKLPPDFSFTEE